MDDSCYGHYRLRIYSHCYDCLLRRPAGWPKLDPGTRNCKFKRFWRGAFSRNLGSRDVYKVLIHGVC